jgi:hypothetical protein
MVERLELLVPRTDGEPVEDEDRHPVDRKA